MEICHCMHQASKVRCSHRDFCERIAELETRQLQESEAHLLQANAQLHSTITELENKNTSLLMFADTDRLRIEELEATAGVYESLIVESQQATIAEQNKHIQFLEHELYGTPALKEKTDD